MQNTIKILIITILFFFVGIREIQAQTEKKEDKKEVVEVDGVINIVVLLGDGLWFEFKKRLNLVSEKEIAEKKKKAYKVKLGEFSVER